MAIAGAGFLVELLVEPPSVEATARQFPDDDATLRREPGFIGFRLGKRPVQ